jgi:serine/threonine protein kinase
VTTFGRYEILDKLGEGAMGVVYRARDTALGRVVAIKMLSAELGGEEELTERFQREAEAVGRLSHPNIVTVYDRGQTDGQLFMVMELLEGDDLRSLIEQRLPIPLADRVRVLQQICEGLAYAHSRGVVHRDIKPANILVTTTGRVKILDFGLARVAARSTITRRGVLLGTPDYMSPEQASGKNADRRSDLFSAGSVFYEMLSLSKPFKGKTLHSVLYQILSEDPEPLLTLCPDLPARLAAVVHGMLRKDPEKRYPSMDRVGQELQEIHVALRRSRGRSALPQPPAAPAEDLRAQARERLARGRAHFEGGRPGPARTELEEALAIDPGGEEAAELLWKLVKRGSASKGVPEVLGQEHERRVLALLSRAGVGRPDEEALPALAELALIAPDDTRLADLMRQRAARARTAAER